MAFSVIVQSAVTLSTAKAILSLAETLEEAKGFFGLRSEHGNLIENLRRETAETGFAGLVVEEPDRNRESVEGFRDEPGRGVAKALAIENAGGALGEAGPNLAEVVARSLEVLADEMPDPFTQALGEKQDRERRDRKEEEKRTGPGNCLLHRWTR